MPDHNTPVSTTEPAAATAHQRQEARRTPEQHAEKEIAAADRMSAHRATNPHHTMNFREASGSGPSRCPHDPNNPAYTPHAAEPVDAPAPMTGTTSNHQPPQSPSPRSGRETRAPAAGWRQVPMPAAIKTLPRDGRGYPVGWATRWDSGTMTVRNIADTGPTLVCTCVTGRGRPLLGQLCPQRQRACIDERRCQQCGQRIKNRHPALFIAGAPDTSGPDCVIEAPLHRSCAAYTIQVCPHLITGYRSDALYVAQVQNYLVLEQRARPERLDMAHHTRMLTQPFIPGDPAAHAFGALDNLLAVPQGPWVPATQWLADYQTAQ
ncbi:hypothetical protein ABTY61_22835 [Kitasatospora sp. NPDC096128]|uniref:hypothetical protein n=1 Tax=Kitasatospora sp. NPDC096128 TaxID=3155547 RepID=UPI003333F241